MSRWLKNVNALLENLDGRVEETVEERYYNAGDDDDDPNGYLTGDGAAGGAGGLDGGGAAAVDNILAKRGLLNRGDDSDDEDEGHHSEEVAESEIAGGGVGGAEGQLDDLSGQEVDESSPEVAAVDGATSAEASSDKEEIISFNNDSEEETSAKDQSADRLFQEHKETKSSYVSESVDSKANNENVKASSSATSPAAGIESQLEPSKSAQASQSPPSSAATTTSSTKEQPSATDLRKPVPPSSFTAPPKSNNNSQQQQKPQQQTQQAQQLNAQQQKELRKLRRTVLQLNSDLESAEREIEAQRKELERSASRMERDRSRHKQEKETSDASHKVEMAAMTALHDKAIKELKERNEEALKEMEERVTRAEQRREIEGGERDKEMAGALERERMALSQVSMLREENSMLNSRVQVLDAEISRLETRLDHSSSQLELASERERNAEEQLDKALSLHARQLGVRQKREAELEQTVADLGAALVVAKGKVEAAMRGEGLDRGNGGFSSVSGGDDGSKPKEEDPIHLMDQLRDSQDEVETLRAQLFLERQRCSTLHNELQDLSKEQADELSVAHAKQRQYERNISDLTTLVAKLKSSIRRQHSSSGDDLEGNDDDGVKVRSGEGTSSGIHLQYSGDDKKETDHLRKQINSLSEKIIEQQSKIDHSRGEISTLKNRLKTALSRAETAEKALEAANQRLLLMDTPGEGGYAMSGMSSADEEMGMVTTPNRRRKDRHIGSTPGGSRRGFRKSSKVESIRSALSLHPGRIPSGGCQELLASLLDTFDNLAVDLGSHFRHYPISRLAFMMYLVILHAWAFFLLVYHAHAQGTGGSDHYGPESLMKSYRHMEQVPKI